MEFGAATATLSKKVSNGYGVSGKSAYDGIFTAPVKLRAPGLSSGFEDYCEIFGGSEASLGSSIPILEVPELNERKILEDIRRSKLDYSKVFGGFGNLDTAVPYEELLAEPKRKHSFPKGARRQADGGNQSSNKDPTIGSKEIPQVSPSASAFDGSKRVNMSYHKINQGSENRISGKTYVTQLHAVPTYTCLIEEVNPLKMDKADTSMPVAQDPYPSSQCKEGIMEGGLCTKSVAGPSSPDRSKKHSSNGGVEVQKRSDSIHLFFDACEMSHGSNGTNYIKVPPSDNLNADTLGSVATKYQVSINDASEGATGADSPTYLDDMVDSNSEAAASMAALRKAIEEAQQRINVAKESMKRKKEGFPDRVKRRFNNDLKANGKTEAKPTHKTMRFEDNNMWQTFGQTDALLQVKSEIGKPMRAEQVIPDLRAKEDVREAQKTSKTTQEGHKEEGVDQKEADHEAKVLEFEEVEYDKKVLYTEDVCQWNEKNTGTAHFEKPEESGQTIEVVEGAWEQGTNEEKISAGNEADGNEELVSETKLAQETLDYGAIDTRLKVDEDEEETENEMDDAIGCQGLVDKMELCERKQGEQGITIENEKKVVCKLEDTEKKVEGNSELEEYQRNLRALLEPVEVEKKIAQEQQESEDKVKVSCELKECEPRAFLESVEPIELIDNEKAFSPHSSELESLEKQMENLVCVDDGKLRYGDGFQDTNEKAFCPLSSDLESLEKKIENLVCVDDGKNGYGDSFRDTNQEIEHFCRREDTDNRFSNTYVQGVLEEIMHHIRDEEKIQETITEDIESDGNKRLQNANENEEEPEGASYLVEENERERKDNSECVEVMTVTQASPNSEEEKTPEGEKTTETSPGYEPDETVNLNKMQAADTSVENEDTAKVNLPGYAYDEHNDVMVASNASFQYEGSCKEPEAVQERNESEEEHCVETSTLTQGALQLNDTVDKVQNINEAVTVDGDATNIGKTDVKTEKNEYHFLKEAENECNLTRLVEESTLKSVGISSYVKEAEVAMKQEIYENQCESSDEEQLIYNENDTEASKLPSVSEWKSSTINDQEINNSNLKENHQATLATEEKIANGTSQKVELEKEHLRNIDEAKGREREREKEKLAVERAIREARERAFAEARERAALERAAAEARRKNISDGRDRLGKTTGQTNEKTPAEKAAVEAKLKAERAAVERATAEARARALERALSEKAAFESRYKSDKFVAEKSFGTYGDNGIRPNFYSKSFSHGDAFDIINGETAQRCKARSERHQRIGERVAKALAEKNMRDRLVQKEQEERNRLAEALDADVKRWSSGKEGNLRALLSTLQYILGHDSGWQAIPLTDIVTTAAVKKAYRKATLFVHPDKLQQRGASIHQKYICEKVFDLLKDAWNRFNMEER